MRIEIFIQAKTKNPAVQQTAQARWLIRSVSNAGQVTQKDGCVSINTATSKRAALQALADALSRFNKAAVIRIFISDDYVRNMCSTNMPNRWRANGWHKIKMVHWCTQICGRGSAVFYQDMQWPLLPGRSALNQKY